ncbi:MAG: phosphatase PAP2 family protein [Eubacterium sp.]|nr:phosphatase PAP2 family protein [Eubacterium sp.]
MKSNTVNIKKQKTIMYFLYVLVFLILFLIGTFKDLQIDIKIFNYENGFGIFMERFGAFPQYITQLLGFSVLIAAYHKPNDAFDIAQSFLPFINRLRNIKIFNYILYIGHFAVYLAFIWGAFCGSDLFLNFILGEFKGCNIQDLLVIKGVPKFIAVVVWSVVRIALVALCVYLFTKVKKEKLKMLEFMAIAGLILFYSTDIIPVIKAHFHRVRFREMIAYSYSIVNENGQTSIGNTVLQKEWAQNAIYYAYTPWYKIGEEYNVYSNSTSFPSGHTASACFAMLLPMLVTKGKKADKLFIPAFIIGFAYTLGVGISRLIRGAHFMSDIAAAALIMFILLLVIMGVMNYLERYSENKIKRIKRRSIKAEVSND